MIALIPAGGSGERWGGYYKELLPIGEGQWLLNNAITTAFVLGADRAVVITTPQKATTISLHLERHPPGCPVSLVMGGATMWDSLMNGMKANPNDSIVMVMPDTIVKPPGIYEPYLDLEFGVFKTTMPERFSIIHENKILTKRADLSPVSVWHAWGVVYWSRRMTRYFLTSQFTTYDQAFQAGMDTVAYRMFPLDDYTDMASWTDYSAYIRGQQ